MRRGVTVEQVRGAVGMCKRQGMQTGMFLMWGYEGEELEDIEATAEHIHQCRPDVFFTTVSYPIRGTPYYDQVAARLVNIGPWEETTDRDVRVQGRHSRRFYRQADDLLRSAAAEQPDPEKLAAARAGLRAAFGEVEA
jgi:radical SAM superfamily enzyme YgiQ (UPF0313 family)